MAPETERLLGNLSPPDGCNNVVWQMDNDNPYHYAEIPECDLQISCPAV